MKKLVLLLLIGTSYAWAPPELDIESSELNIDDLFLEPSESQEGGNNENNENGPIKTSEGYSSVNSSKIGRNNPFNKTVTSDSSVRQVDSLEMATNVVDPTTEGSTTSQDQTQNALDALSGNGPKDAFHQLKGSKITDVYLKSIEGAKNNNGQYYKWVQDERDPERPYDYNDEKFEDNHSKVPLQGDELATAKQKNIEKLSDAAKIKYNNARDTFHESIGGANNADQFNNYYSNQKTVIENGDSEREATAKKLLEESYQKKIEKIDAGKPQHEQDVGEDWDNQSELDTWDEAYEDIYGDGTEPISQDEYVKNRLQGTKDQLKQNEVYDLNRNVVDNFNNYKESQQKLQEEKQQIEPLVTAESSILKYVYSKSIDQLSSDDYIQLDVFAKKLNEMQKELGKNSMVQKSFDSMKKRLNKHIEEMQNSLKREIEKFEPANERDLNKEKKVSKVTEKKLRTQTMRVERLINSMGDLADPLEKMNLYNLELKTGEALSSLSADSFNKSDSIEFNEYKTRKSEFYRKTENKPTNINQMMGGADPLYSAKTENARKEIYRKHYGDWLQDKSLSDKSMKSLNKTFEKTNKKLRSTYEKTNKKLRST